MNCVLKYPGAKNRLASWICGYIPAHKVYLEPFAGSLAVLFNKERCHIETVNDLNGEIVNFFRVLRDNPEELKRLIELTPYSREEYDSSYEAADNDIERARRYCVRCWQGFGCANVYHNGFKSGQQTKSPNPARAWASLPETLKMAAEQIYALLTGRTILVDKGGELVGIEKKDMLTSRRTKGMAEKISEYINQDNDVGELHFDMMGGM